MPNLKRSRSASSPAPTLAAPGLQPNSSRDEAAHKSRKLTIHGSYLSTSPYPHHPHPTSVEALKVYNLLAATHPSFNPIRKKPSASGNSAQTCGNVPIVLDSLIGTVLSQNTSGRNSSSAKRSLDSAFGRNNFAAIASAPQERLIEVLRHGGLAKRKAATIQNLLESVKVKHGDYSLQHLAETGDGGKRMGDDEIMAELLSYSGVGPKTASCVLLFCLGRDSFAVDTHVFRLSKVLGWVPAKADRVLAQAHLDLTIPDNLKYGLHVLMISHGRRCRGCRNKPAGECILKDFVKKSSDSS